MPPGFLQPQAASAAGGQRQADDAFDGCDAPADGRARQPEIPRGPGDVADRSRGEGLITRGRLLGLLWIGHSLGGNSVGLIPGFVEKVDAMLGVAAQVPYLGHWSGFARVQAWVFFHWMLPLAVRLLGRAPGRAPGRVLGPRAQDLPAGAALEWAAWERTPGFLFGDDSLAGERTYHRFGGAVHLWSVTDDHLFGPAPAVDALAAQFSAAHVQRHVVAPADLGVKRIEHFGPFRRDLGARLWPRLLAPIEAAPPQLADRLPAG